MEHKCKKTDLKTVEKCELNREQTIKGLQEIVDNYSGSWKRFNVLDNALSLIKELTEENERLRGENAVYANNVEKIAENYYKQGRADTVRKMHSEIEARCIKGGIYPAFVKSTIDQIAEEIIGGSYGKKD